MNRYTHHHTAETIVSLYSAHDLCQRIHTAHKDALSPLNTVFSEGFSQHTTWHTVFLYSCTSAYKMMATRIQSLYLAATDWFLYWITWKVKQVKFCNSAEKTSVVVILQFCLYLPFLSYNKCYLTHRSSEQIKETKAVHHFLSSKRISSSRWMTDAVKLCFYLIVIIL